MLFIFIFGPTVFILNALIQYFGSYVNTLIESATWTEVYETTSWQNGWTLFFYTWWFAWAPFVSLFIARISYGRSIKEFVPSLFAPCTDTHAASPTASKPSEILSGFSLVGLRTSVL